MNLSSEVRAIAIRTARRSLVAAILGLLAMAVSAASASDARRPNVLFLAIDDLRNDLGSLGVAHAKTPQLDAFAQSARVFSRHYVQVPTCGASRCALLRGRYPTVPAHVGNNAIKQTHADWAAHSLPALFRQHGYRTLALGKVTHYPGGRTGANWSAGPEELPGVWDRIWIPDGPWKTPQAMMHGYAGGGARRPGESPAIEAHDGPDEAYPDAWVAAEAVQTLQELARREQPWFFAVGFFKPHLPFAAPKRWHDLHAAGVPELRAEVAAKPAWPSGWHGSGEFRRNYAHAGRDPATDPEYARQVRAAYAASTSYMDAQVGRVLDALRAADLERNTIVVIWSDHGFLLGEHAIWGKHCLYEQALRSPLMIRHPDLPHPGRTAAAIVETVNIYPTLADLCGLPTPEGLNGKSLRPYLADPDRPSAKKARGFWNNGQRTIRTDRWRLIAGPATNDGAPRAAEEGVPRATDAGSRRGVEVGPRRVELFDLENDPDETRNVVAEHPDVVRALLAELE